MPEKEKGFVIKDRRGFADEGKEQDEQKEAEEFSKEEAKKDEMAEELLRDKGSDEGTQLPEINFSTFIFSLNSSALVHLGIVEDPATGNKIKNLPLAKQTIDIIGMLEEKTRGNLTDDESRLVKLVLYDLRMMYVKEKG